MYEYVDTEIHCNILCHNIILIFNSNVSIFILVKSLMMVYKLWDGAQCILSQPNDSYFYLVKETQVEEPPLLKVICFHNIIEHKAH